MSRTLFFEKQRFRQKWLWGLMLFVVLIFIVGNVVQLGFGIPFGNNPMSDEGLILTSALVGILILLMRSFQLETSITEKAFAFRYLPIIWSYRIYKWGEIEEIRVREYDPLNTFLGWGFRWNFWSYKGWCYSVDGDMAVEVILKSGKKFLVGTQKPDKMKEAIKNARNSH